jgi:hypothetical protein
LVFVFGNAIIYKVRREKNRDRKKKNEKPDQKNPGITTGLPRVFKIHRLNTDP